MRYKWVVDLRHETKDVVSSIGFIVFLVCNILYDYTEIGEKIWFLGNSFAFALYAYALTLKGEPKIVSRLVVWVAVGSLIEEMAYTIGIGNTLIPNSLEWISIELFLMYEYLKYKGWVK